MYLLSIVILFFYSPIVQESSQNVNTFELNPPVLQISQMDSVLTKDSIMQIYHLDNTIKKYELNKSIDIEEIDSLCVQLEQQMKKAKKLKEKRRIQWDLQIARQKKVMIEMIYSLEIEKLLKNYNRDSLNFPVPLARPDM